MMRTRLLPHGLSRAGMFLCGILMLCSQFQVTRQDPLVCSCSSWDIESQMCRLGGDRDIEYWECAPSYTYSEGKANCRLRTTEKDAEFGVTAVIQSQNTVVMPVRLSQTSGILFGLESGHSDGEVTTTKGVTWASSSCFGLDVNILGESFCYNELIWKGRNEDTTEDESKFSYITSTLPSPNGAEDWSCEYKVSRVLCKMPALFISSGDEQFEDVIEKAECGPGTALNEYGDVHSCYKLREPLHVGQTLSFELTSTSAFREDQVDVQSAVEPGVPQGMHFASPTQAGLALSDQITRLVRWTPRAGQQAQDHIASFVGFIPPQPFLGGKACERMVRRMHIKISVAAYESQWIVPADLSMLFSNVLTHPFTCRKSGIACNGRDESDRVSQCQADKLISNPNINFCTGSDENADCCTAAKGSSSSSAASQPPPDLVFNAAPGFAIQGLELTCRSNVTLPVTPTIRLANFSIMSAFGARMFAPACSDQACEPGPHLEGWGGFGFVEHNSSIQDKTFQFSYMPKAGRDEGYEKRWCFACADDAGMYDPAVQCIRVVTRMCEIYIERGDDLQSLARAHHLDRNWRRLWNQNSELQDPHQIMHGDSTLRLGPIYTVRDGDTLVALAGRFETTVKRLLDVNPHIVNEGDIMRGLDVCVVPCSNKPPPSKWINALYDSVRARRR